MVVNSINSLNNAIVDLHLPNILLNNVSLDYTVKTKRKIRHRKKKVQALRPLSFVAKEGELIGVIGRNGSGKSSLLRLIAGLETPTTGEVYASSQPALISVGGVLNQELTGEENIELGCLALGISRSELPAVKQRIEDLAGIGEAIYRPMKTYSSGMGARLRFAISLANSPRITLIDEALSTGDAATAERYTQAMNNLIAQAGTVFLVTHAAQTIEELCTRAIWLDFGEKVMDGDARLVARKYRWFAHNLAQGDEEKAMRLLADAKVEGATGYISKDDTHAS